METPEIITWHALLCVRREILDAFWSRETSMVSGNFRRLGRDYFESVEALSMIRPVITMGTNEFRDIFCMRCEVLTLYA